MSRANIQRRNEIINMRNEGKTYQEIANKYGVSRQAIHNIIVNYNNKKMKQSQKFNDIVYCGIYDMFMEDVDLSMLKMCDIMGYARCTNNARKIRSFLCGKSDSIRKSAIDNVLKYLNKPYKEVFSLRK